MTSEYLLRKLRTYEEALLEIQLRQKELKGLSKHNTMVGDAPKPAEKREETEKP